MKVAALKLETACPQAVRFTNSEDRLRREGTPSPALTAFGVVLVSLLYAAIAHAEPEVQMGRPCSRPDLTQIAARGGLLALSQPAAHTIRLYDVSDERFDVATTVGRRGQNAGQFETPSGVAIDAQRGLLFVSDTNNHRVQVFRVAKQAPITATFAKSLGAQGGSLGHLDRPTALSLDAAGNLYVLERGNLRVQVFSPALVAQRAIGNTESLREPVAIAVAPSGEAVYVADSGLRRVQVFDRDGALHASLGKSRGGAEEAGVAGTFFHPAGVAVGSDGAVLVSDCGDHVVQRFDARGGVLTPWGTFGPSDGALNQPRALAVDDRDRVIVLDFSGRRAQMFTPTGAFMRAVRLVAPQRTPVAPAPAAEK